MTLNRTRLDCPLVELKNLCYEKVSTDLDLVPLSP